MKKWNEYSQEIGEFIVPKVMLHDEITTDGYGKCLIELLTKHGMLLKTRDHEECYEWILGQMWENKHIILCLDGLSLDRHRGFYKKLVQLPLSFSKAYKQSLVFQKALTRVTEVSGPLHTAFHILQSIYIVHGSLLKCAQFCFGWKKIKFSKVSENYRLCVNMLNILYEEVFRILLFNYLFNSMKEFHQNDENPDLANETIAMEIGIGFLEYIDNKIDTSTDERWRMLINFFKMASTFKQYEYSMKMGDSVMLESIEIRFCGIFLLLKKYNYVEIVLSQMERKYKASNYDRLQNIRINMCCRYKYPLSTDIDYSPYHVLDEVMKNVNMWVKSLPLGDDNESWLNHSPNVALARRCLLFDRVEYKRGLVNFEKLIDERVTIEREYDHNKYVPPNKQIEKKRMFEFLILYFNEEIENRMVNINEMEVCLSKLTTSIRQPEEQSDNNNLDQNDDCDLDMIFDNINAIYDKDKEVNFLNESIGSLDNDNNSDSSLLSIDENNDNIDSKKRVIKIMAPHKYACRNIENEGLVAMKDKNYKLIRIRTKE